MKPIFDNLKLKTVENKGLTKAELRRFVSDMESVFIKMTKQDEEIKKRKKHFALKKVDRCNHEWIQTDEHPNPGEFWYDCKLCGLTI